MISDRLEGLTGFLGFVFSTLQAPVAEVDDACDNPGKAGMDASDGNLNVIQVPVFVWSREIV